MLPTYQIIIKLFYCNIVKLWIVYKYIEYININCEFIFNKNVYFSLMNCYLKLIRF